MFENLLSKASILPATAGFAVCWFAKPIIEPFVAVAVNLIG